MRSSWLRTSGQGWKLVVFWSCAAVTLASWPLYFWRTEPGLLPLVLGLGGPALSFASAAWIRCRVCGESVPLSVMLERDHPIRNLGTFEVCPICGDPGDGSNPKGWTYRGRTKGPLRLP